MPTGSNTRPKVTRSSGNVFADLGVPDSDIALAKANLAHHLVASIRQRKMNQSRAAELLGITQPKVSDLVRGKLEGFTIDRLFRFLNRLDQDVDIAVSPASRRRPPRTRVIVG